MSKSLKTIQVIFQVAKVFSKIAYVMLIVGAVFCLVGIGCLAAGQEAVLKMGDVDIVGIIEQEVEMSVNEMNVAMVCALIFCVAGIVLAWFSNRYFKRELVAGTPFTFDGAKELKRLGILMIVLPLAAQILNTVVVEIWNEVTAASLELSVDTGSEVAQGILFLVMAVIFQYGAELETGKKND